MPRAILHLGAHKCASKFIQHNLRRIWRAAEPDSHLLETNRKSETFRSFRRPLLNVLRKKHPDTGDIENSRNTILKLSNGRDIVVSSELLIGKHGHIGQSSIYPMQRQAAEVIKSIFKDFDVTVIFIVRRQDTLLESWYMQQILHGRIMEFSDFRSRLPNDLRWSPILNTFSEVITNDVKAIPFSLLASNPKDFLGRFLADAGLSPELTQYASFRPTNSSLSAVGYKVAKACFADLTRPDRLDMRRFLMERFPRNKYGRAEHLTVEERTKIIEDHAADNELVLSQFYRSGSVTQL